MISFSEDIKSKDAAIRKLGKIQPEYKSSEKGDQINPERIGIKYGFLKSIPSNLTSKVYDRNLKVRGHKHRSLITKDIQSVPLDQVRTDQHTVSRDVVKQKLRRNWKDHNPIVPVFVQKKDGTYHLFDGNHRVAARKLRGFTHIRGIVVKE